jgi:hypothetical protein
VRKKANFLSSCPISSFSTLMVFFVNRTSYLSTGEVEGRGKEEGGVGNYGLVQGSFGA